MIAFAESLQRCQHELQAVLEGWLIVKLRHEDKLNSVKRHHLWQAQLNKQTFFDNVFSV